MDRSTYVERTCCEIFIDTDIAQIDELLASKPRIKPAVNQIEVHPFNTRTNITEHCRKNDIIVEAYAPLARALRMKHPTIVELAKKYGCTSGQLLVRWSLQHGFVPLPKSTRKERIVENANIGFFQIDDGDMKRMDALDEYLVTGTVPLLRQASRDFADHYIEQIGIRSMRIR